MTARKYFMTGIDKQDSILIKKAFRQWLKENIFRRGRSPGADAKFVDDILESAFRWSPLNGAGLLGWVEIPSGRGSEIETMHIEFYASLDGNPSNADPTFIWELEGLRYRMERMTYSIARFLGVRMADDWTDLPEPIPPSRPWH